MHELQRSLGNRAFGHLVQAQLTVSQPGDVYEEEADRVADQVMRMPESSPAARIQRICAGCEEELQREAAVEGEALNESAGAIEPYLASLSGRGQALPESTRAYMEPRFGADFSQVRLHTDSAAAESARAVDALAFTAGRDIVFGAGQYTPESESGRRLLAHELTHVRQQGSAPDSLQRRSAPAMIQRLGDVTRRPATLDSRCPLPPDSPHAADFIEFGNRVTSLTPLDRALIDNFVHNWHAAGGSQTVRVDGFASRRDTDELNWELSCQRAETVVEELRSPSSGDPGIPDSFIVAYAHGETDEFGIEERNRRATLTLSGGTTPGATPPPPTAPPPEPAGAEACARARQTECVMALGGCPETRPGGIPSPEEITQYNAECRERTGYPGPDVTPTEEECDAGQASPSVDECAQAREEETNICGPDISQQLADVLADVVGTFGSWTPAAKREACDQITGVPVPFLTAGFIMAWDIHELFLPETGWLCAAPYHPPCGMPPLVDCDDENAADCGNSVQVDDKCFLAGTVNYALFGQICRLCNDEFGVLSETTMENLILGWKAMGLLLDDPGPPTAWARAGFRGFPGHIPVHGNRAHCRGRCPVPYAGSAFTWVWEPHQPR